MTDKKKTDGVAIRPSKSGHVAKEEGSVRIERSFNTNKLAGKLGKPKPDNGNGK